jgi:hypothetical protein
MALVGGLEDSLVGTSALHTLTSLPVVIRAACEGLRSKGYTPRLIIVPQSNQFACALFAEPLWRVNRRKEWGVAYVGEWEGLTVLRFPYSHSTSILVIDPRFVFGVAKGAQGDTEVTITDADEHARQAFVARASETGTEPLPQSADLHVDLLVKGLNPLGLADLGGAVKIDITTCNGCFALIPGEMEYHRATCELVQGAENIKLGLFKHLPGENGDRAPCSQCRPDRWQVDLVSGGANGAGA